MRHHTKSKSHLYKSVATAITSAAWLARETLTGLQAVVLTARFDCGILARAVQAQFVSCTNRRQRPLD